VVALATCAKFRSHGQCIPETELGGTPPYVPYLMVSDPTGQVHPPDLSSGYLIGYAAVVIGVLTCAYAHRKFFIRRP